MMLALLLAIFQSSAFAGTCYVSSDCDDQCEMQCNDFDDKGVKSKNGTLTILKCPDAKQGACKFCRKTAHDPAHGVCVNIDNKDESVAVEEGYAILKNLEKRKSREVAVKACEAIDGQRLPNWSYVTWAKFLADMPKELNHPGAHGHPTHQINACITTVNGCFSHHGKPSLASRKLPDVFADSDVKDMCNQARIAYDQGGVAHCIEFLYPENNANRGISTYMRTQYGKRDSKVQDQNLRDLTLKSQEHLHGRASFLRMQTETERDEVASKIAEQLKNETPKSNYMGVVARPEQACEARDRHANPLPHMSAEKAGNGGGARNQ